uniref:Large ribosomal subunit protein bL34m n=1 Tax=Timema tahoe TaxID=61484 RepID=A0A7R9FP42_9NEOP|nr:unnamed protein product [Timema tahoe]
MLMQLNFALEVLRAHITRMLPHSCMHAHMSSEVSFLDEGSFTLGTLIWFHLRVSPHVGAESRLLRKPAAARFALEQLHTSFRWNRSKVTLLLVFVTDSVVTDTEQPCSFMLRRNLEQSYSRKEVDTLCSYHSAEIRIERTCLITHHRSHYSSRRKIKQLPVILRIDGVSRVTCSHTWSQGLVQGAAAHFVTIRTVVHSITSVLTNNLLQVREGIWSLMPVRTKIRVYFPRPNERRRIKRHGWNARMSTPAGRKILMNRILKGKRILSH